MNRRSQGIPVEEPDPEIERRLRAIRARNREVPKESDSSTNFVPLRALNMDIPGNANVIQEEEVLRDYPIHENPLEGIGNLNVENQDVNFGDVPPVNEHQENVNIGRNMFEAAAQRQNPDIGPPPPPPQFHNIYNQNPQVQNNQFQQPPPYPNYQQPPQYQQNPPPYPYYPQYQMPYYPPPYYQQQNPDPNMQGRGPVYQQYPQNQNNVQVPVPPRGPQNPINPPAPPPPAGRAVRDYIRPEVEQFLAGQDRDQIRARNFYLNPALIQMVQGTQFSGAATEDPHLHLNTFLEYCDTVHNQDVSEEIIKLRLFHFL